MSRRVIVCGGRDFTNSSIIAKALKEHLQPGDVVVTGGARGSDTIAHYFAFEAGYTCEVHRANWLRYGNYAGLKRNQHMLDLGADLVIAFPGGRGTEHMCQIATKNGIEVKRISE